MAELSTRAASPTSRANRLLPRWDLTKKGAAHVGAGSDIAWMPFECEFCDVIQYLGRKQRWKEPEQVIRELDVLYARGFRGVFFADDNLTVMRRRARALLQRLREWNQHAHRRDE